MTQIIQTVACIVDIMLIICFLKYIVCHDMKTSNLGAVLLVAVLCSILGGFVDFCFVGNVGTFPVKLLFPLCYVLVAGSGSFVKRVGNYFLALLLFLSAEILSIFVELFIFNAVTGASVSNNRFLSVSIILNFMITLVIWGNGSKGKLHVTLSAKEWMLLLCVNVITYLLISAVATERKIILIHAVPQELLRVTINYSAIFLYIFFVISLVNGRIAAHFKEVGQIRERHMAEQLKYFSSYKQAQEETRRFRHDMKNHLLYLQALSAENKVEEMKSYIKSLNDRWEELPRLYATGNDVVDTILNAKHFMYEENQIEMRVSGVLGSDMPLKSIDVCTVFSNALDNAINANIEVLEPDKRFIEICMKANRNYYLITIQNPISKEIIIENNRVLSEESATEGHGYGLSNMEQTLKHYGGYLKISASSDIFTLELVFPR